jgi:DNA primase
MNEIEIISNFCKNNIDSDVKKYFEERGWTKEIIDLWEIGLFPKDDKSLFDLRMAVAKNGFDPDRLDKYKILKKNENGTYWSMLYDRIIFPIRNAYGEYIALSGRARNDKIKPKYINTKFEKGLNLYGLNTAIDGIIKDNFALVFEGFGDVIISRKHRINNTVCCMGTAFGFGHYCLLSRYTDNIVLLFDKDSGGEKAIKTFNKKEIDKFDRSKIFNDVNKEVNVFIVKLTDCTDPDEFIIKYGKNKFYDIIKEQCTDVELQKMYKWT